MAKNFRDDLRRRNLASLIPSGKEEEPEQQQQDPKPERQPAAGQAPVAREKVKPEPVAPSVKETTVMEAGEDGAGEKAEAGQKSRRGRKPTGTDKQPVTFRLDEDLIFDLKAAAFWDRRDFTEIVTIGLQKYLETLDQGELRRARREYRKRLEEER